MRNISKLAVSLTLLATQVNAPQFNFGNVAAAAEPSAHTVSAYEVKLNTNNASAVEVVAPNKPNYDTEVLDPLHTAQAAQAAKVAAASQTKAAKRLARIKAAALAAAHVRPAVVVPGTHADWMRAAGIAESDFGYVDYIVDHESGWSVTKSNYRGSGAYGLGQAMPASKMAIYGSDYLTDPVTQLKWANAYAKGRYGSWAAAYSHWTLYHRW